MRFVRVREPVSPGGRSWAAYPSPFCCASARLQIRSGRCASARLQIRSGRCASARLQIRSGRCASARLQIRSGRCASARMQIRSGRCASARLQILQLSRLSQCRLAVRGRVGASRLSQCSFDSPLFFS